MSCGYRYIYSKEISIGVVFIVEFIYIYLERESFMVEYIVLYGGSTVENFLVYFLICAKTPFAYL